MYEWTLEIKLSTKMWWNIAYMNSTYNYSDGRRSSTSSPKLWNVIFSPISKIVDRESSKNWIKKFDGELLLRAQLSQRATFNGKVGL